jgi:outer membrane protein insertion porin family
VAPPVRDTRDFVLNPTVGEYRVLSSQIAGGVLGGENDFYTFESSYQRYAHIRQVNTTENPVVRQSVFAWRVRAGYADSYGRSDVVPVENRYFLGGANSVRGYEESGLGPHDSSVPPNPTAATFCCSPTWSFVSRCPSCGVGISRAPPFWIRATSGRTSKM